MSLENLLTQVCTIVRAGNTVDRYGNSQIDWEHSTSFQTVCHFQPNLRVSKTNSRARDAGESDGYIYLPAGTDILPTDKLLIDDGTYRVYGMPVQVDRPGHGPFYVEVRVKRSLG